MELSLPTASQTSPEGEVRIDDFRIYEQAKTAADEIVRADPDLREPEHAPLLALLSESASARALLVTA